MMRTLLVALILAVAANAFVPAARRGPIASQTSTQLQFGFLKELGLEKPSWLPDFGGKKEEETTNDAPPETEAKDDTGDDAPKDDE